MTTQEDITRIRVLYTKGESLRFTGHLDMQRIWERLLRRSELPLRYSQGFHPRARLNLASALPLGFISEAELLDFWMDERQAIDEIQTSLRESAPPGLVIKDVHEVSLSEDALQVQMSASEFEVTFFDPQEKSTLQNKIEPLLSAEKIIRKRRKKIYDLRPLILDLQVMVKENGIPNLWMRLRAEQAATGRPDEVLDELGYENTEYLVTRTKLIL
jgi:radical SAM-linked protein